MAQEPKKYNEGKLLSINSKFNLEWKNEEIPLIVQEIRRKHRSNKTGEIEEEEIEYYNNLKNFTNNVEAPQKSTVKKSERKKKKNLQSKYSFISSNSVPQNQPQEKQQIYEKEKPLSTSKRSTYIPPHMKKKATSLNNSEDGDEEDPLLNKRRPNIPREKVSWERCVSSFKLSESGIACIIFFFHLLQVAPAVFVIVWKILGTNAGGLYCSVATIACLGILLLYFIFLFFIYLLFSQKIKKKTDPSFFFIFVADQSIA